MRRKIGQPRFIDPSLVEIGDEISVQLKEDHGITTTLLGVVAKRLDVGTTRYLITKENSTILAWDVKRTRGVKVTLIAREEPEQSSMFNLPDEIIELGKRIA